MLLTTPFRKQHKMAQNKDRKRPQCITVQEDKYPRVCSLRQRNLTGRPLAAALNSTGQTLVSALAVKRRLHDAGLLTTDKEKPYLRLANKKKKHL